MIDRQETVSVPEQPLLTITLLGREGAIGIGKNVAKALGSPRYVSLRISYKNKSLLLLPCDQKDVMSCEMPHDFLNGRHINFRIYSLSFVQDLLQTHQLNCDASYVLEGKLSSKIKGIYFPLYTAKPISDEGGSRIASLD